PTRSSGQSIMARSHMMPWRSFQQAGTRRRYWVQSISASRGCIEQERDVIRGLNLANLMSESGHDGSPYSKTVARTHQLGWSAARTAAAASEPDLSSKTAKQVPPEPDMRANLTPASSFSCCSTGP